MYGIGDGGVGVVKAITRTASAVKNVYITKIKASGFNLTSARATSRLLSSCLPQPLLPLALQTKISILVYFFKTKIILQFLKHSQTHLATCLQTGLLLLGSWDQTGYWQPGDLELTCVCCGVWICCVFVADCLFESQNRFPICFSELGRALHF